MLPMSLILPQMFEKREVAHTAAPKPQPIPIPHIPEDGFERLKRHPLRVACPKCRAEPGRRCNASTLGRHKFHRPRIEALQAILAEETP